MMRARLAPIAARNAISFPRAEARARKKIRDVRVRDQQHADDRAEKDIKRGADIADHIFAQRFRQRRRNACSSRDIVSPASAAIAARSDCACATVTPGFNRAIASRL